jgi:7-cyano-7-deazaguanine synthase
MSAKQPNNAVAVVSGGMDSVTMLHWLLEWDYHPHVISFDYGQKHVKELEFAAYWAQQYELDHTIVPMRHLGDFLHSALTDSETEVPEGHYAADNMKATVVPNRNMIMMSIAAGLCVSEGASVLGVGVHAGDHAVYPDCRPEFIVHMETTLKVANQGFIKPGFTIAAPFINVSKTDIAIMGQDLHVDWSKTWSCYKGGELHCGKCGTCVERREAFAQAGIVDPTTYETSDVEVTD